MRFEYQADNKYNQSCKNNKKKYIYHTRTLSISKNTLHQPHPLTINQNTIHLPLELKNRKTCTPQHSPTSKYSLWEQSSQLLVMMTKVIITQEWIKIVKILFIHSKYWTIHCSLTHTHPIQTLTKILLEFTI